MFSSRSTQSCSQHISMESTTFQQSALTLFYLYQEAFKGYQMTQEACRKVIQEAKSLHDVCEVMRRHLESFDSISRLFFTQNGANNQAIRLSVEEQVNQLQIRLSYASELNAQCQVVQMAEQLKECFGQLCSTYKDLGKQMFSSPWRAMSEELRDKRPRLAYFRRDIEELVQPEDEPYNQRVLRRARSNVVLPHLQEPLNPAQSEKINRLQRENELLKLQLRNERIASQRMDNMFKVLLGREKKEMRGDEEMRKERKGGSYASGARNVGGRHWTGRSRNTKKH